MHLHPFTPAPARDGSCATDPSWRRASNRPRRILVADDEEDIRHLLSSVLTDDGFEVNGASDGQQAWELLLQKRYDLLVTDNDMPRLTGVKLIERVRMAGMSLPVLIASGTLSVERVNNYPQLQIAAVLLKPFDILEFLTVVRITLSRSNETATRVHETFHRSQAGLQSNFKHSQTNPDLCKL